ncbi:MAG: DUF6462 family protein [Hominisplanchenecus sp.]
MKLLNALKSRNISGELLTYKQAAERSNLGINTTMRLAKESGALRKIGRISRVDWSEFYSYISTKFRE